MKSIGVTTYGPPSNLQAREIDEPGQPAGRELLIQVKAMSVNPIDVKIRGGIYDDAHDYYEKSPKPFHIVGPDGSGIVLAAGPEAKYFKAGDEVFFGATPVRQGSAAEKILVDERSVGHKPVSFDFVEAASLIVSLGTAYEALINRMEIKKGEQAGILIINGAGGVGSAATQLARNVLQLPVVVTTASRPETIAWSKKMGATHVLNHRQDLKEQLAALDLEVSIRYIFILHNTANYLSVCTDICEPLGKICSVVQAKVDFYHTQALSKSITFCWVWLGTRVFHNHDREGQYRMMEEMSGYCDSGLIKPYLTGRFKLTRDNLVKTHELIESGQVIGKLGLGVDEDGEGVAFQ